MSDRTVSDDSGDVFSSPAARRDALTRLLVLAALAVITTLGLVTALPELTDSTWVRGRIVAFGPLAPLALIGIQTIQVVVAPIPGQLLGGVGGYVFGFVPGTLYTLTGVLLGSAVVFALTRRFGRPYAERVVDPDALERWDEFVEGTGIYGLFALFLLPMFPDDLLCFVAGFSGLRLRTFLALVLAGRGPAFVVVSYAGTQLSAGRIEEFLIIVSTLVVFSLALYLSRGRLIARLKRLASA